MVYHLQNIYEIAVNILFSKLEFKVENWKKLKTQTNKQNIHIVIDFDKWKFVFPKNLSFSVSVGLHSKKINLKGI